MKIIKNLIKYSFRISLLLIITSFTIVLIFALYVNIFAQITAPEVPHLKLPIREQIGQDHYRLGENWLKKNNHGIWEMYISGTPYERGLAYGVLSKELCQQQEEIFVAQINNFVPHPIAQKFIRLLIGFFNRHIPEHIPLEFKQEIYGVSRSFSDHYDYIAPKYMRILNYHAAHDIGHALNDYSVVGCTSFAVKGSKSASTELLIGRNFDFYVGDEFAEEKVLLFVEPDSGIAFSSYSWAGFMGVVSGLNAEGLSVTINASKSDIPTSAKMPISLLAREILQYSTTIEQAIAIARKREVFVSEIIMVSSKKDNTVVLIEKSPNNFGVFTMDGQQITCANHYQSDSFKNDPINKDNITNSDSKYRFDRVNELLNETINLDKEEVATILRDQKGPKGIDLGMGNPRAINQLIAHHSVIIAPDSLAFYISTKDFQLNKYLGYKLDYIFTGLSQSYSDSINEDPFLYSKAYEDFSEFKNYRTQLQAYLLFGQALELSSKQIEEFIASNKESYLTYDLLANYSIQKGQNTLALKYVNLALSKVVASVHEKNRLIELKYKLKTEN